jgi:hypothetical protein
VEISLGKRLPVRDVRLSSDVISQGFLVEIFRRNPQNEAAIYAQALTLNL